jgi:hypothetical protein
MNTALLFAALLLQQGTGMTLEEELAKLAKGQKYLDKVSAAWSAKLPQERLLGVYMGRTWLGSLRLSVKAAPAPGAFELTLKQDMKFFGRNAQTELHAILDAKLAPLSAERTEFVRGNTVKGKLTVADGKITSIEDGHPDRTGTCAPGQTVEANLLPLFVRPEEDGLFLLCFIGDKGANTFDRLPDKVDLSVGGKKQSCSVLKVGHLSGAPDLWYYSEDGRPLEMRMEVQDGSSFARRRPITEDMVGKALNEPLDVNPAERRVLDAFVAIKKNDATALAACFDFDRFAKEAIPEFAAATPAEQKKSVASLRQSMLKNLLGDEKSRASLAEPLTLEDAMVAVMVTTEEKGVTSVVLKGAGTWKLHQPTEGPRKGQWLIFLISQ